MAKNKASTTIYDSPYYQTQAQRVVEKFGGVQNVARALSHIGKKKDPSAIYKWTYEDAFERGGGLIPSHALKDILTAARAEGVLLTAEDLDPMPKLIKPIQIRAGLPDPSTPKWKPKDE